MEMHFQFQKTYDWNSFVLRWFAGDKVGKETKPKETTGTSDIKDCLPIQPFWQVSTQGEGQACPKLDAYNNIQDNKMQILLVIWFVLPDQIKTERIGRSLGGIHSEIRTYMVGKVTPYRKKKKMTLVFQGLKNMSDI